MKYPIIYPQFFTATILNWEPLLLKDQYKEIIIQCLQFLVKEKRIQLFGFVIMSNHVHFIWQPTFEFSLHQIQHSFMSFTAKGLKNLLSNDEPEKLEKFRVNKYDRKYPRLIGRAGDLEERAFKHRIVFIFISSTKT